jgi:Xaa-Pro aminopeptidase
MTSFHAKRMARVRQIVGDRGWDALLVTQMPNVFYLTGFTGSAGALVVGEEQATLFVDGRYKVQAREEAMGCKVQDAPAGVLDGARQYLQHRRGAIVAVEAQHLTMSQRRALGRRTPRGRKVRWVGAEGVVERLRARKDASEAVAMRAAAKLGAKVLNEVVALIRPGVRELELAAEIEYRMKRLGASGAAFETIVATGPRSALPHARPSQRKLRRNEFVVVDMGAILGHYCSDLTRTVYLGRPTQRARLWHAAVREAQQAAAAALRPGATAGSIDEAARAVLRKSSLDGLFSHSTGHGLGLEVHEEPRLGRGGKAILEEGNVVTIEPGVYAAGYGGIRIEDDYLITGRGAERLTKDCRDVFAV